MVTSAAKKERSIRRACQGLTQQLHRFTARARQRTGPAAPLLCSDLLLCHAPASARIRSRRGPGRGAGSPPLLAGGAWSHGLSQSRLPGRPEPRCCTHGVICIAGCHQKAIKFQAGDQVKYDLFCCLCDLFILSRPFLRAWLSPAAFRMNRSRL